MLSFLWFSSNKNSYREVSNIFNMSISCFKACLDTVLNFMVEEISPEFIKFPTSDEEEEFIAKEFEKISGFPNVLGCIDGTYISTKAPKHKIRSTYVNRHDGISITMQGICDSNLKFLDVYTVKLHLVKFTIQGFLNYRSYLKKYHQYVDQNFIC